MFVPFQTPVVMVPTLDKELSVVTAVLTSVPDVGNVTFVDAVVVSVRGKAPDVVKAPSVLTFPPKDSVYVDHTGLLLATDKRTWLETLGTVKEAILFPESPTKIAYCFI
jgi:hypothetical protein